MATLTASQAGAAAGAGMAAEEVVFLTGATGTVGRELLWRILQTRGARVVCLVRAADDGQAGARLAAALDDLPGRRLEPGERQRMSAVAGDLTRDRLGLEPARWDALAAEVSRIVHGGATVTWDLPLADARAVNVDGTRRMLELAEAGVRRGRLTRFDYIGTCMVAGRRRGLIGEEDLDGRAGFFNTYERSKFEAEQLVRGRAGAVPVWIYRLSMVVGDSATGYTSTFNVMYWPLKMMARGQVVAAPADRTGRLDMVPLDYVGRAVEAISAAPGRPGTGFHIAAGPENDCTVGDVLALAAARFGVRPPRLVPPRLFALIRPLLYAVVWGRRRDIMKRGRVYRPYLHYQARFDTTQARAVLDPLGIRPPSVHEYFDRLIDYAVASDWGRPRRPPAGPAGGPA